jgi:hypothetical protein
VDDADLVALLDETENPVGRLGRDGAADLHDKAAGRRCEHGTLAHDRYSALMRT